MTTVALGDVAEFINGFAFKPDDWHDDGLAIIRIQNLTDSSKPLNVTTRSVPDKYRVRRGELLVSWSATLGVFVWNQTDEALVNQHIFRVIPSSKVDQNFLRRMLAGALVSMGRHLHGATMMHVNRAEFLSTRIPLPTMQEQRRIAAILDHADALRAKRRQVLAHLDTMTQSIFHWMFGDPLRNERGLPVQRLSDWIEPNRPITYGILKPGPNVDDGVPYIRVADMKWGGIDLTSVRHTSHEIAHAYRRSTLKSGDLLVSIRGHVGRFAIVPSGLDGANITQDSARLAVVDGASMYVRAAMESPSLQEWMARRTIGAAVQGINLGTLRLAPLPRPPRAEAKEFETEVGAVGTQRAYAQRAIAADDELFASLQSRAFHGEL